MVLITKKNGGGGGGGITETSTNTLTNKTLDDYTNFIHADGIHLRVKATEALTHGDVIKFVGFNAGEQAIEVAKRDSTSVPAIGVIHDTLAIGEFGMAVSNGLFKNINTSAFTVGSILYPNTSGGFTTTNPGGYAQQLAYVVRSHAINGEIMINVGPVYGLDKRGLTGNSGTNPATDFIGTTDAQPLVVKTNNVERMRILSSGNVSIGRGTPTHKLDVWGSGTNDGITTNIGLNLSTVPAPVLGGGFTLTPTTGTALQIGQYYYRVTFYSTIGETTASNAVLVTTTAGNQVVSIAGIPVSTDPTVIGRNIYRNKVGEGTSYGSIVGVLADNTTTVFVDSLPDASIPGALSTRQIFDKLDTTNRFITLNNTRAMFLHSSLTAFGLEAGNSITTGGANVLLGYRAGRLINSGSNNTIVGYTAGNSMTTAIDNTIIGMSAGLSLTTGSSNTVLTRSSLQSVTTGSFNVTAGYFTGSQLTTSASNNVLLGSYIMSSGSWTTASNNVGIGHNATPLTVGGSNQLNLHNLVFGEGSGQANRRVFVRAGTSQTGNIFEVQNNGGTALTYVNNVGDLRTPRVYSAVFRDPVSGNTWVSITGTAPNQVVTIGNTAVLTLAFTTKSSGGTITFDNNVAIGGSAPQRILHTMRGDGTTYSAGIANTAEAWIDNTRTTDGNFSSLAFATRDFIGDYTYSSRIAGIHQSHTSGSVTGELAFTCVKSGTQTEIARMTAEAVGIGADVIEKCAILELRSDTKGFLPPRMSVEARTSISPVEGLIVYDTDDHKLYVYTTAGWEQIQSF